MSQERSWVRVTATYPDGQEGTGSRRNALDLRGVRKDVALIEADGARARIYVNGVEVADLAAYERMTREYAERSGAKVRE